MSPENTDAALELHLMVSANEAVSLQGGTTASHPVLTLSELVTATALVQDEVQRACRKLADVGLIAIDGVSLSPLGDRS